MPGEFQIIREYFQRAANAEGLVTGIGDDGAVLRPNPGLDQVVVTDTIVEGRHFPAGCDPRDIGWRALAVNLSDIAAMGATPRFAFLNLTLTGAEAEWLKAFADGFFELASDHGTVLAGGDVTRGPLSVTVTVIGELPAGMALLRSGARPGDLVCVSGAPGEAAAGLEILQRGGSRDDALVQRFLRPQPRLQLGRALRGKASAAIDVSDGLAADLGHVLTASGVGARIATSALPFSAMLKTHAGEVATDYVLAGGDDYELCFCASRDNLDDIVAADTGCEVTVIGEVIAGSGIEILDEDGRVHQPTRRGWDHFSGDEDE